MTAAGAGNTFQFATSDQFNDAVPPHWKLSARDEAMADPKRTTMADMRITFMIFVLVGVEYKVKTAP